MKSLDDYDQLKRVVAAKRKSGSAFVRQEVGVNVRGKSNGETAFRYFTNRITESRLYLLDEPENSLSVSYQRELAKFLEDSARFYRCQFVVATHSPFLLAMKGAAGLRPGSVSACPAALAEAAGGAGVVCFFRDHRAELALEEKGGDPWSERLSYWGLYPLWGAAGGTAGFWQPAGFSADLWSGFPVYPWLGPYPCRPKSGSKATWWWPMPGCWPRRWCCASRCSLWKRGPFTTSPSGGCSGCCWFWFPWW